MPVLLPVAAAAALVWTAIVVRWGGIARFAPFVLLIGTVLGPPFFAVDGPIQLSLDRVLWMTLLATFAWYARLGFATWRGWSRGDTILALWCAQVFLSAALHGAGPAGVSPIARWLFYLIWPIGMYAVFKHARTEPSDIRWISNLLIALGVYLSITAICETRGWHALVFPKFIVDPTSIEFFGRGRGPLLNPVGTGLLINLAFVAAVVAWPRRSRPARLLTLVLVPLLMAGIYCTLTRSIWMGAMASCAILGWLYAPRRFRVWGVITAASCMLALVSGVGDDIMAMKRDKHLSAAEAAESVKLRPILATVAWKMFVDRPLIGCGYAQYLNENRNYLHDRSIDLPLEKARPYIQHNVFLAQLVECGLIGLSLFVLLLAWWWLQGLRLARDASDIPERREVGLWLITLLMSYAVNGMFHDVSIIAMVHMFLFSLAGLNCAMSPKPSSALPPSTPTADSLVEEARRRQLQWQVGNAL